MQLKLELKNKYKCANLKNDSYGKCHSQPTLCFCFYARVLAAIHIYFFYLDGVENKGNRCETIKHTFRNTTYSKTIRFRLNNVQYQSFRWHRK